MTQEHEIRLEVTLNGEAAHKLLLEAGRRGVKPKRAVDRVEAKRLS
jgi:hypothetical protein